MLRDFNDVFKDELLDPARAAGLLSFSISEQDGDFETFLLSLRDIVQARGGMAPLAETTGLGLNSLYKTLSRNGNPEMKTILRILKALGLQICFAPAGKDVEKVVRAIEAVETGEPSTSEEQPVETLETVKA